MGRVTLELGGNHWPVACRDGEEGDVEALGAMLAERWEDAQRAAGDAGSARVMLFVALMLADDLSDARRAVPSDAAADESALERLADRLEAVAAALENAAGAA